MPANAPRDVRSGGSRALRLAEPFRAGCGTGARVLTLEKVIKSLIYMDNHIACGISSQALSPCHHSDFADQLHPGPLRRNRECRQSGYQQTSDREPERVPIVPGVAVHGRKPGTATCLCVRVRSAHRSTVPPGGHRRAAPTLPPEGALAMSPAAAADSTPERTVHRPTAARRPPGRALPFARRSTTASTCSGSSAPGHQPIFGSLSRAFRNPAIIRHSPLEDGPGADWEDQARRPPRPPPRTYRRCRRPGPG